MVAINTKGSASEVIDDLHQRCPLEHTAEMVSVRGTSTPQAGHFSSRLPFSPPDEGKGEVAFLANVSASTDNSGGVPGSMH